MTVLWPVIHISGNPAARPAIAARSDRLNETQLENRTIWTGDNLDVMRGMNSECVDLVYLDPPFNSNRTYAAPVGSKAAGAAFKDSWTLSDLDEAWHGELAEQEPLSSVRMNE